MRKTFSVLLVIMLLAAMAVPAMAATEYVFDMFDFQTLPDFVTSPDSVEFLYDGVLPSGKYQILMDYGSQGVVDFGMYDLDLVLGDEAGTPVHFASFPISGTYGDFSVTYNLVILSFDLDGCSVAAVSDPGGDPVNFYATTVLRLIPVSGDVPALSLVAPVVNAAFDALTSNWYLTTLLCLSLLGIGVAAFRRLKRAR